MTKNSSNRKKSTNPVERGWQYKCPDGKITNRPNVYVKAWETTNRKLEAALSNEGYPVKVTAFDPSFHVAFYAGADAFSRPVWHQEEVSMGLARRIIKLKEDLDKARKVIQSQIDMIDDLQGQIDELER